MNKTTLICGCIFLSLALHAQKSETNTEEIIEIPDPDNEFYSMDSIGSIWGTDPFAEEGEDYPYIGDDKDSEKIDEPYTWVDEEAEYPGLMQFISENYNIPEEAIKNGISGKLYVRFIVNTDGSVSDVTIELKTVPSCPACDTEALRVIHLLKGWTPGKIGGKPVRQWYILPIYFST